MIDEIRIDLGADRDAEVLRFDADFRSVGQVLQTALRRARGELH
jgi:hypothetical protein